MPEPAATHDREHDQRPRALLRDLLGDALRRTRLEQGRTLADVAAHARVSMPYLSEVERGRKEASSEVLGAICHALRVELSDLLVEVGHDLAEDNARRATVIRLAGIRRYRETGTRPASAPRRPGDVLCLAA